MKSSFKKIRFFLKKHIFSVICLLLATIICISGTLSYSKYITSDNTPGGASAGSFTASASINGISALSFTNTAFWGGSSENDKIAMNALRQLKFSVNNYQTDSEGNKKVAEVRMRYNLVFSAPVVFASKLAFQVFNEHDVALLPQIVMSDLINSAPTSSGITSAFNTEQSTDYNSLECQKYPDIIFGVSTEIDSVDNKTIRATNNQGIVITVTTFEREVDQSLLFRLWDVSNITNEKNPSISSESGKLEPAITVNYKATVEFYRISISMPEFILPAGSETTVNHSVRLAPTDSLEDPYLGSTLVTKENDNYTTIESLYGKYVEKDEDKYQPNVYLQYLVETTDDNGIISTNIVTGDVVQYEENQTITNSYSYQTKEEQELSESDKSSVTITNESITYKLIGDVDAINVTATLPTKSNYNTSHIATDTKTSNYKTTFYIHRLEAEQEAIKATTSTKVTTEILSKNKVTETEISESIKTTEKNGNEYKQTVTKTEIITVTENIVKKVTTETTTITQTCTIKGYVYRGYYIDSSTSNLQYISSKVIKDSNGNNLAVTLENVEYLEDENGNKYPFTLQYTNDSEKIYLDDEKTSVDTKVENKVDSVSSEPITSTSTLNRTLSREYTYTMINIEKVSQSKQTIDDSGTTTEGSTTEGSTTTETTTEFTSGAPLNMYEKEKNENGEEYNKQVYYLSSSYSKNYPFYVDVIFEQVLE